MQFNINREYKDRLFKLLFGKESQKANVLSLYNALNGTDYTKADDIEINTLEDTIYIGMKNDVSFIIDDHMPLWEQQSTFNPNMPVRGLIYYGRLYDKFFASIDDSIYGRTLIKIPTPKFIIFYNGDEDRPAVDDLKLSDSFTVVDKSGDYEWTGTVYNLNKPENAGLLKACRPLAEYTELVNRIKRNRRDCKTKEEALLATDEAVQSCIRDGILTEFLEKHRAEVIDVILTEFDEAKFVATIKKEGLREGLLKISRRMRDRGRSIKEIADELGEDEATISEILNSADME